MVKKALRTSKRNKKSSVEQVHSLGKDWLVPQPEDDESSPGENSFIYSPSRRRTRGEPSISFFIFIYFSVNGCNPLFVSVSARRADSSEQREAPVTRSRVKVQVGTSTLFTLDFFFYPKDNESLFFFLSLSLHLFILFLYISPVIVILSVMSL